MSQDLTMFNSACELDDELMQVGVSKKCREEAIEEWARQKKQEREDFLAEVYLSEGVRA